MLLTRDRLLKARVFLHLRQKIFITYFRFDSTWEAIGCHTSENGDTTLIRCTCEKDLCNAPITDNSMYESILASSSPYSNMLSMYYLFGTTVFAFIISYTITY